MYGKQGRQGNRVICHPWNKHVDKRGKLKQNEWKKILSTINTMTSSNYNQQWSTGYYSISQVDQIHIMSAIIIHYTVILDSYTEKRKIHDSWTQINHKDKKCFLMLEYFGLQSLLSVRDWEYIHIKLRWRKTKRNNKGNHSAFLPRRANHVV